MPMRVHDLIGPLPEVAVGRFEQAEVGGREEPAVTARLCDHADAAQQNQRHRQTQQTLGPGPQMTQITQIGIRLIRHERVLRDQRLESAKSRPQGHDLRRATQSARSADIGSIRVAWRAGSQVATSATTASAETTAA